MASRCEIKLTDNYILLSGTIDETFFEITNSIPSSGEVNVNLKNLQSINSTGIREWIKLMQKMKAAKIHLFECPKAFIDQANMVKGFIPTNAKVMSFYVPYFNEKTETEKNVLFVLNEHYSAGQLHPLKKVVDDAGEEMEIDIVEAKYFKFIKG